MLKGRRRLNWRSLSPRNATEGIAAHQFKTEENGRPTKLSAACKPCVKSGLKQTQRRGFRVLLTKTSHGLPGLFRARMHMNYPVKLSKYRTVRYGKIGIVREYVGK